MNLIKRNDNHEILLKEEFLHDVNAKRTQGNKARNDVERCKEEGYHPLVLSVDTYQMSTPGLNAIKLNRALDQLKQGDELLIQFPMLHHSLQPIG